MPNRRRILDLINVVQGGPIPENTGINPGPTEYINLQEANLRLFGEAEGGVITQQNINSLILLCDMILAVS